MYDGPYTNAEGQPFNGPYVGYGGSTGGVSSGAPGVGADRGPDVNGKGETYNGPYTNV